MPEPTARWIILIPSWCAVVLIASMVAIVSGSIPAEASTGCAARAEDAMIEVLQLEVELDLALTGPPSYLLDERSSLGGSVGRVMYCLELDGSWVSATFEAPHRDPMLLGLPVDEAASARGRRAISVASNVAGVATGDDLAGSIEFFPNSYATAASMGNGGSSSTLYDADDTPASARYGSLQIHVHDVLNDSASTVLAWNRWALAGTDDVGIGPSSGAHPDWTFAGTAGQINAGLLRVFAAPGIGVVADPGAMQTGAVVPRTSPAATMARTTVTGSAPGATRARTTTRHQGVAISTIEAPIDAGGSFTIDFEVPVARRQHSGLLEVEIGGAWHRLHTAADIVGGDVYLIQGQSNAVARVYGGGSGLEFLASPWIRSYGSQRIVHSPEALQWNRALASRDNAPGAIGQWGMRFAADVSNATDAPIAVLNGAHGGRPASFFQRNDADPLDPSTNYGRFLERVKGAGVADDVQAIGWYQGESDWTQPEVHRTGVTELIDDWLDDFPALQTVHQVQIHNGCGSRNDPAGDLPLRNVQREIGLERNEVTTISTTALPDHDGCHYLPAGYGALGAQVAQLFLRDHTAVAAPAGLDSPVAVSAAYVNGDSTVVRVAWERSDDMVDPAATTDFSVDDPTVNVVGLDAGAGWLDITFDSAPANGATLRYLGVNAPYPVTPFGAGVVAFDALAIDPVTLATPNCDHQLDIGDALIIAQYTVGTRVDSGGCPSDLAAGQAHVAAGDIDASGTTDIVDALIIARCTVGLSHPGCPTPPD